MDTNPAQHKSLSSHQQSKLIVSLLVISHGTRWKDFSARNVTTDTQLRLRLRSLL